MRESYSHESADDKKEFEFAQFVHEENFSAEEVRESYFRFIGISENDSDDERLEVLVDKMDEFSRGGYPINRFAKLIDIFQDIEDSASSYENFVNDLDISEREKLMLCSIFEQNREGVLECYLGDSLVKRIHISDSSHKSLFKSALLELLGEVVGGVQKEEKMSFLFEEA